MVEQRKLNELIDAAATEDWELVDQKLPRVANDPQFLNWAINKGLYDDNPHLRDLAASILERSKAVLTDKPLISRLREMMKGDENPYAGFRAAFALFRNGDHSDEVVNKISEAAADSDTKEIAERYLAQIR